MVSISSHPQYCLKNTCRSPRPSCHCSWFWVAKQRNVSGGWGQVVKAGYSLHSQVMMGQYWRTLLDVLRSLGEPPEQVSLI